MKHLSLLLLPLLLCGCFANANLYKDGIKTASLTGFGSIRGLDMSHESIKVEEIEDTISPEVASVSRHYIGWRGLLGLGQQSSNLEATRIKETEATTRHGAEQITRRQALEVHQ